MNKLLKVILLVILALALLATGCTSNSGSTSSPSTYQLEINLLGREKKFLVDSQGRLKSSLKVSSGDSRISLSSDKGTKVLDKDGKPLQSIQATTAPSPPLPPEDAYIIGTVYNLEPRGATFNPSLMLTLSYDAEELPEGLRENDLYIAYYDDSEWSIPRYKKIDTNTHSITTQVYHFTSFAILGPKELASSSTPTQGTKVGNLAPDFQLDNLDGESVSLSYFRGKPVLINFWATWCSPCRAEMPYLQQVYEEWLDEGLILLAINAGESSSQVSEFMESYSFSFPVLLDTRGNVSQEYNIYGIPTTFFVDKDGIIQDIKIGSFRSQAEIEEKLNKLVITE